MNSKTKALEIKKIAEEKKALGGVILNMRRISSLCDFFVILTGTSQTHIRAIADGIREGMDKQGVHIFHFEGDDEVKWVVLDYTSVLVHIFSEEARKFYDLEHLWADAPQVYKKEKKSKKRTR